MGKIKKIKADRKRAEVERQLKKAQKIKLYSRLAVFGVLFIMIFMGGFYGYRILDSKYGLQGKIAVSTAKIKEIFKKEKVEKSNNEEQTVKRNYTNPPKMTINTSKKYFAKFETNLGDFEVELYASKAPKTVNNFVFLAREKFYDGLIFHRVIKDFMIQGGDPAGNGSGGPGYKFEDEINDVKLTQGVLAMANSGPNTNGSQFFIVTKDKTDWLDGKHTAFGKVISGLDIVMNLEKTETDESDKPKNEVIIKKITISEE